MPSTAAIASPAGSWNNLVKPKRVHLADDDPALPPAQLAARLKQRAKLARRKERELTGEAPLVGGRPLQGDSPKPATLQRRKRKAARERSVRIVARVVRGPEWWAWATAAGILAIVAHHGGCGGCCFAILICF